MKPRICSRPGRARLSFGALALGTFLAACSRDSAPGETGDRPQGKAQEPPRPTGRWRDAPGCSGPLTPEQRAKIEELQGIGYASGSTPAPELSGVTLHHRERAYQGWNLYTSGHGAMATLMDMDGKVLHTWSADFARVWPDEHLEGWNLALTYFWRRAFLYDNGDLLAIFDGHSLVKLDKDSNVLWKSRCGAHHDLEVLPGGDMYVLTREAHVVPEFNEQEPILEDFVSLLGPDGAEKQRFSLLEALDVSPFRELAENARKRRGDVLHTNSIAVLDGRLTAQIPAFKKGNLLVSSRPLSFLSVVDLERQELVWTLQGSFREQHDPKVLENGNLLVFDNAGRGEASTVLELDPVTGKTVWEYRGSEDAPFYSRTCGTAERLPNGNTLITESDSGRAFEVTAAGEIVWEFWNPQRAGPEGEYIATLFEVVRVDPERHGGWSR